MYFVNSVKDLQDLNPFIIIGCGGGGEKFANFEGVQAVGFIDDDKAKQGREFCNSTIYSDLDDLIQDTEARSIAIMLPIGAEGAALKYAVQALDKGKNVVTSFRSLPLSTNSSLLKFAQEKNVVIKEISPRLDVIKNIFGNAPPKCTETLPKLNYKPGTPVIFVGGTSQEAHAVPEHGCRPGLLMLLVSHRCSSPASSSRQIVSSSQTSTERTRASPPSLNSRMAAWPTS